jgi:hypothetical protein
VLGALLVISILLFVREVAFFWAVGLLVNAGVALAIVWMVVIYYGVTEGIRQLTVATDQALYLFQYNNHVRIPLGQITVVSRCREDPARRWYYETLVRSQKEEHPKSLAYLRRDDPLFGVLSVAGVPIEDRESPDLPE